MSITQKNKKWNQKIYQSSIKIKIKNKATSNEELISEVH
jgi:hypothetical protein